MKQYINKFAIVAEIERRKKCIRIAFSMQGILHGHDRAYASAQYDAFNSLLPFLDTLEVKEINSTNTFIKKSENYFNSQLYDWVMITNPNQRSCSNTIPKEDFIEDFRNYMKRE